MGQKPATAPFRQASQLERPLHQTLISGVAVEEAPLWHPFHLVHCEILDHGYDEFEGKELRTVKIIAHKKSI